MTIDAEMIGVAGSFVVSLVLAVWRITNAINKQKAETLASINNLRLELVAIKTDTKHTRDDHDQVVKLVTILEKVVADLNNQWGRIRDVENDVGAWGAQISKIRNAGGG